MYRGMHQGDLIAALVDYWLYSMTVQEMQDLARQKLTEDAQSWPTEKLIEKYKELVDAT